MPWRLGPAVLLGVLSCPTLAWAAGGDAHALALHGLPVWSVLPFAGLLLSIAVLPLVAGHFWHSNRNRFLVSLGFSLPVIAYLAYLSLGAGQPGLFKLEHALVGEYVPFIILLGSLYVISGGILLDLNLRPHPAVNVLLLAVGAVLANFIGTTGASMLLIRPFLRVNKPRANARHLPIFFIFIVSNLGGLLTPLGDPPLFLGFLRGIDFFWTLSLWPQWLLANGVLLAVFLAWDVTAFAAEPGRTGWQQPSPGGKAFTARGLVNFLLLAGVIAMVLLKPVLARWFEQVLPERVADEDLVGQMALRGAHLVTELGMVFLAALSLALTSRAVRTANAYSWAPIVEVAVLFVGIFITMVPALALLEEHGAEFGLTEPYQYFWLTGLLSSFLDNAPTYLTFATMAVGSSQATAIGELSRHAPDLLAAVSCGAVFMGANTYIGNGPNFMVKAIADESDYRTPSFFGYMAYSGGILLPVFALVTYLFFPPGTAGP